MANIMAGISRGISFAMWAPDFVCGLGGRWLMDKSVYDPPLHFEPGGSILRLVEDHIVDEDWLLWLSGGELRTLIDCYNENGLFPAA